VQHFGSSSPFVQQVAAAALGALSAGGEDLKQQIAAVPGAVKGLVQLLGSSSRDVHEAAAWVLFYLADGAGPCSSRLLLRQVHWWHLCSCWASAAARGCRR
jgi:hypothetical protein